MERRSFLQLVLGALATPKLAQASDGPTYVPAGTVEVVLDDTGVSDFPTRIVFYTTGDNRPVERMRITAANEVIFPDHLSQEEKALLLEELEVLQEHM